MGSRLEARDTAHMTISHREVWRYPRVKCKGMSPGSRKRAF